MFGVNTRGLRHVALLANPSTDGGSIAVLPATGSDAYDLALLAFLCVLLGAAMAHLAVRRGAPPVVSVNEPTPLGPDGGGTRPARRRAIALAGPLRRRVGNEVSRIVDRRRRR